MIIELSLVTNFNFILNLLKNYFKVTRLISIKNPKWNSNESENCLCKEPF